MTRIEPARRLDPARRRDATRRWDRARRRDVARGRRLATGRAVTSRLAAARRRLCQGPRTQGERGSVVVEFLGLGVLLVAPLIYVLVTLAQFQAASLAAVTIADQAARIQAQAPDAATAEARRQVAVAEMARGHGVDPADVTVSMHCDSACPGHNVHVHAEVRISVQLPLMPTQGARAGAVHSSATAYIPSNG